MKTSRIAPVFWVCLVATIALIVLCIVGVPGIHWLLIPYPTLLYLAYIALVFLFGTRLVSVALANHKSGKESKESK
jgi:arginine exporter protein ArgO